MANTSAPVLTIYTPTITNRIRYVFDLVFQEHMGIKYKLVDDAETFVTLKFPKLSYAPEQIKDELFFCSTDLLFEKGLKEQKLSVYEHEGTKVFFNIDTESALPFDPFAAIFYMVSRYEEYLPHVTDKHGRFPAEESFASRNDFIREPVVNKYIEMVRKIVKKRFPKLKCKQQQFRFTPTYDIDSAYAYYKKGTIRNLGGFILSLMEGDFPSLQDRIKVLFGQKKDPFNTYDWQLRKHEEYDLSPVYFFLVGDYDEYDKNLSINASEYQSLIKSIADHARVGIHPSYASNDDASRLNMEIRRLSRVLKRDIIRSRQHFLRLTFPDTYQNLLDHDIRHDYTMGFASQLGFRAGICSPFFFYNLRREIKTTLRIHPFCVMDATLKYYNNAYPQEAIEEIKQLMDEVKSVNGHFISLWHNNSLSDEYEWEGWKKVYEALLQMASE